ncbi:hypothetical protein Q5P01_005083 [Channa striata]|uniref:Uncharacterized protein n=1 Tax=Channa striata TaxID=64152 RepID=A0AA88NBW6_CHASR|nr:hypothetical protein Q5P01_005083 [Channa striata]
MQDIFPECRRCCACADTEHAGGGSGSSRSYFWSCRRREGSLLLGRIRILQTDCWFHSSDVFPVVGPAGLKPFLYPPDQQYLLQLH